MSNSDHVEILKKGVYMWNMWRSENPDVVPDLSGENFFEFRHFDRGSHSLSGGVFSHVNFSGAKLGFTSFALCNLTDADFSNADLYSATFKEAYLLSATFKGATLSDTDFIGAMLDDSDFTGATMDRTRLDSDEIAVAKGLDKVIHRGPSVISIEGLLRSRSNIPEGFLRGCGVPESLIVQIPALVAAMQPIQFYSCFISYSGKNEDFARRLHSRMREAELRVWFAPEDMKGGDKLYDQIDRAIQVHDRLLLVLSESSMQSRWVETEVRRARKVELLEGRRKLFPIRLVGYEALQEWSCIDSTTGEDLAEEVRGYYIPDFSNWKIHDDFEQAFARLLADLKASA
jgi:hypothetical protein